MRIFILLTLFCGFNACVSQPYSINNHLSPSNHILSAEVNNILNQELIQLASKLNTASVTQFIQKSLPSSPQDIQSLDLEWRKSNKEKTFSRIQSTMLQNTCSQYLMAEQILNNGLSEVFVTDTQGKNVCLTNMTSDYYQADEDWWTTTYNNGKGKNWVGDLEWDDSVGAFGFPMYVALYTPNKQVIGVAKAMLNLIQIREALDE